MTRPHRSGLPLKADAGRLPLIDGETGWAYWNWETADSTPWRKSLWDIPAVLRAFDRFTYGFPDLTEKEAVRALVSLFSKFEVRHDHTLESAPDGEEGTQKLLDFMLSDDGRPLHHFWRVCNQKAPSKLTRHIRGVMETELWGVWLPFWEMAHYRIPRPLAHDSDVVWWMAWCQGLTATWQGRLIDGDQAAKQEFSQENRLNGFIKLCRSRWFQFGLVSPYMSQFGIMFPGADFTSSVARMEFLLMNPYLATDRELDFIMDHPLYIAARHKMIRARAIRTSRQGTHSTHPPTGLLMQGAYRYHRPKPLSEWQVWSGSNYLPEPKRDPRNPRNFRVEQP